MFYAGTLCYFVSGENFVITEATALSQVAADLIADAKNALEKYDSAKAAPLIGLADYIFGRQN